jgi:hypothetical protein
MCVDATESDCVNVAVLRTGSKMSGMFWFKDADKIALWWVDDDMNVPMGEMVWYPVFEGLQGVCVGANVLNILIKKDLGVFLIKSIEGSIKIVG